MRMVITSSAAGRFACRNFSAPDIAIDLGTGYLRACSTAGHEVFEAPSRVADGVGAGQYPLQGGVIVDGDGAARILRVALQRFRTWHARPSRVLATVPSDASAAEQELIVESLVRAGAGMVAVVPEPVAAAVGASLDDAPHARLLIDVGEGVTDMALLERGALAYRASIRLGCADMRECIIAAAYRKGVFISRGDADALLCGRDGGPLARGALTGSFSRIAASAAVETIAAFVSHAYRELDRSTRARMSSRGVCLTGGGALTRGVRSAVATRLGVPVFRPAEPLRCVIAGSRKLLDGQARHVWGGFPAS